MTRTICTVSRWNALVLGGALLGAAAIAGCHNGASPGLELQPETYATARSHFKTKLAHQGPAPQEGDQLRAPAGAVQVQYRSDPNCIAWVSRAPASAQGGKLPAVLFLHGGFALGADDWEMTRPYVDAGYVVMEPALRGENGQGGAYSMFYNEVDDVLAAAEYLARLPYVDAHRIYVAGHSVGGTLTMLAAMTTDRFRAAASFSGSPDQVEWSRGQQQLVPFDPGDTREYRMRSPIAFATSFRCPALLMCGSDEPFFPGSSAQTAELAKKNGLDVRAVTLPGDHFSAVPEEIRRSIEFFRTKDK